MKHIKHTHRGSKKAYPISRKVTFSGGKQQMAAHATHNKGSKKKK